MENTQHSLYGKTCRGHLAPTAEKISEPSSKCSAKSKPLPFMFLDLTGGGSNGMALPCALYVMEGIAIALRKQFLEELNALHI